MTKIRKAKKYAVRCSKGHFFEKSSVLEKSRLKIIKLQTTNQTGSSLVCQENLQLLYQIFSCENMFGLYRVQLKQEKNEVHTFLHGTIIV